MTAKEAYEKNRGKELIFNGFRCAVCGYLNESYWEDHPILIVAFLMKRYQYSWIDVGSKDIIVTHQNNTYGYAYVTIDNF